MDHCGMRVIADRMTLLGTFPWPRAAHLASLHH